MRGKDREVSERGKISDESVERGYSVSSSAGNNHRDSFSCTNESARFVEFDRVLLGDENLLMEALEFRPEPLHDL